jgi:hypothetical protein
MEARRLADCWFADRLGGAMKPVDIIEKIQEFVGDVSGDFKDWTASQWIAFSRKVNLLISEQLNEAPCDHSGTSYSTSLRRRCGTCMRPLEESADEKNSKSGS